MGFPELAIDSVSVVVRGAFNPAIFSPSWLLAEELIGASEYEAADVRTIQHQLAAFQTGWLDLVATSEVFQVSTDVPDEFERCRDVVIGVLRALAHTPIAYLGINRQVHFAVSSPEEWHEIGDRLAPKEWWDDIVHLPGMRILNIEGVRTDKYAGQVHVQVEPSQTVVQGIYVAHNDHFTLMGVESQPADRIQLMKVSNKLIEPSKDRIPVALEILTNEWVASMRRAEQAVERVAQVGKGKK